MVFVLFEHRKGLAMQAQFIGKRHDPNNGHVLFDSIRTLSL